MLNISRFLCSISDIDCLKKVAYSLEFEHRNVTELEYYSKIEYFKFIRKLANFIQISNKVEIFKLRN